MFIYIMFYYIMHIYVLNMSVYVYVVLHGAKKNHISSEVQHLYV